MFKKIHRYRLYLNDLAELKKQKGSDTAFPFGKSKPILNERFEASGIMTGHYFHQDLLIARKIFLNKPVKHVDIGSRTDGFVAHVASYREIEVFDIREQGSKVKNILFKKADLTQLPPDMVGYCDSISSLHAIEHFGLGRYGDTVDYNGHIKAIENITKIVRPGGRFYFSTPIGPQRIEFNAHRVFAVQYLLNLFTKDYTVEHFSYVDDNGNLHESVPLIEKDIANNFGCTYGCGIFELIKK